VLFGVALLALLVGLLIPAACADIPEIPVRNSGIPEIIRDFLLARLSRVILP
jgi:hypothetical protein